MKSKRGVGQQVVDELDSTLNINGMSVFVISITPGLVIASNTVNPSFLIKSIRCIGAIPRDGW